MQGDGRGVHANSNRMRRRNPAHLFRPRQHSGSPRQAPINLQPVSEHEPCLFLYHSACLLGLGHHVHAWARKWVPNAHATQIASQAPRRYAGDPRRRWDLLGGGSRGVGSGGLGTSPNGPLDILARTRFASADARLLAAKSGRETRLAGPHPCGNITDIPVRAAHGGARPTNDRDWGSMASATCCRALVCVLAH